MSRFGDVMRLYDDMLVWGGQVGSCSPIPIMTGHFILRARFLMSKYDRLR